MSFNMDEILITEAIRTNEDTDTLETVEFSMQKDYDDLIRFSVATKEVCIIALEDFIKLFNRALAIWEPLQDLGESQDFTQTEAKKDG